MILRCTTRQYCVEYRLRHINAYGRNLSPYSVAHRRFRIIHTYVNLDETVGMFYYNHLINHNEDSFKIHGANCDSDVVRNR